jgi:Metallo-peptidase family M12
MRNTKPDIKRHIYWPLLTILVLTTSLTTMAQVIPQMIKPLSLQVGTKNYTLLYRNGAQGKQILADLQDKSGITGRIMLIQKGTNTIGTLYMQNGRNYSITINSTKTNLVMLPTPPTTNGNCMVEPSVAALAAAKKPNMLKARQGTKAMLFKPGDDIYSVPVATADNPAPIDLLIVYTTAAATSVGGVNNLKDIANTSVAAAQQAYIDSGVHINLTLLGIVPISFKEVGDLQKDLLQISVPDTEVYKLREQYNADIICMYAWEPKSAYSGMTIANRQTDLAYTTVEPIYDVGNFVMPHEIGHVLGCDHDRPNACGAADIPIHTGTNGSEYTMPTFEQSWHTPMAYALDTSPLPMSSTHTDTSLEHQLKTMH